MDIKETIEEMFARQNTLTTEKARIQGRVEEAKERLKSLENACAEKGIDPNALDEVINKLDQKIKEMTEKFESEITTAENRINDILNNVNER